MFFAHDTSATDVARRFDPRAKAVAYLCLSALVLLATRVYIALAICSVLVGLLVGLRLVRPWLRMFWVLLPTLLLLGVVVYWLDGPASALAALLRVLALVMAGVLFFATTPPEELGEALLVNGLAPQAAFLLEGTMRFVPTMGKLLREVRDAQASRGIRFDGLHLLKNGPALLAPLLVNALRFADTLAEALEARGFGSPLRTPLRAYRFGVQDWLLTGGVAVLCTAVAAWSILR